MLTDSYFPIWKNSGGNQTFVDWIEMSYFRAENGWKYLEGASKISVNYRWGLIAHTWCSLKKNCNITFKAFWSALDYSWTTVWLIDWLIDWLIFFRAPPNHYLFFSSINLSIFGEIILSIIFCNSLYVTTNLPQKTFWIKNDTCHLYFSILLCAILIYPVWLGTKSNL